MAEVIDISPSEQKVCYTLPTSKDTKVFGPKWWDAFEDLASRIPCGACREESESFVKFWHDTKNVDLKKPIFDKANYDYWVKRISYESRKKERIIVVIVIAVLLVIIGIVASKK